MYSVQRVEMMFYIGKNILFSNRKITVSVLEMKIEGNKYLFS